MFLQGRRGIKFWPSFAIRINPCAPGRRLYPHVGYSKFPGLCLLSTWLGSWPTAENKRSSVCQASAFAENREERGHVSSYVNIKRAKKKKVFYAISQHTFQC